MDRAAKTRQVCTGRACGFVVGKAVTAVKGQRHTAQRGALGAIRGEIRSVSHHQNLSLQSHTRKKKGAPPQRAAFESVVRQHSKDLERETFGHLWRATA
jgi:hypothetical protein